MEAVVLIERIFDHAASLSSSDWKTLQSAMEDGALRPKLLSLLEEAVQELRRADKYSHCCELLRTSAHTCRYDMQSLLKLYKIAGHLSFRFCGVELCARHSLNGLLVWSNLPFWLDAALYFIESDKKHLELLSAELQPSLHSASFLGLSLPQLKEILSILRVHAITGAMRSLKVNKDAIEAFSQAAVSQLKLTQPLEVNRSLLYELSDRLFTLLLQFHATHHEINRGVFYRPEVHHGQLSYLAMETPKDSDVHTLGRSIFINLFFACGLIQIRLQRSHSSRAVEKVGGGYANSAQSLPPHCVCGAQICPWTMVGLPSREEMRLLHKLQVVGVLDTASSPSSSSISQEVDKSGLTSLLCEACYRQLLKEVACRSQGGGDEVEVGCAPILDSAMAQEDAGIEASSAPMTPIELPVKLSPHPSQVVSSPPPAHAAAAAASKGYPPSSQRYSEVDDDASILSGVSHIQVEDDGSVVSRQDPHPHPSSSSRLSSASSSHDIPKLSDSEFLVFLSSLTGGIPITLVYSYEPLVEKTRLLFLCSSESTVAEVLKARFSSRGARNEVLDKNFYRWFASKASALYLGWAHLSEQRKLQFTEKKSLAVSEIKNIKVGSARWKNCVKIGSASVVIVIKVDHDEQFQILLRGLTQLISIVSGSHK